ncbi:hypothetical protein JTE90_020021 [Oedothorax gibbosus]|uniref:UNC93-like protein n=1 Tax=Oedothorax gibbosus TaxID=931172 RepID=A0AAV6ULF4_9ARAC|nr:hypothetical protein JTE90_020021 [Oedothorax gibbosus]
MQSGRLERMNLAVRLLWINEFQDKFHEDQKSSLYLPNKACKISKKIIKLASSITKAMVTKQCLGKNIPLRLSRIRIIKNLAVITCTFVLLFTAYDGLSMLQSTMNGKHGIGSASQAVVYLSFAISSLLLPKYTIKKLGCKMTLFVGTVLYLPYIAANAYPTWFTMMSSAVLIGAGAGILWASQSTYFNEAAGIYCDLAEDGKKDKERDTSKPGARNLKLFVIQNSINEKSPSESGLTSEGIITTQECRGMDSRDLRTESKCSGTELNVNILPILQGKESVIGEQNSKNLSFTPPKTVRTSPIKSDNSISINIKNASCLDENLKRCLTETEKCCGPETNRNNQLLEKQHSQTTAVYASSTVKESVNYFNNIENRTSSISQSLKEITIPLAYSEFCTIESVTARFFGCFGAMYYTAQVWSNLMSYYILRVGIKDNVTLATNQYCGAHYCNVELDGAVDDIDEISPSTRYLLIGITVTLSVASSLLVLIFLDPLDTRDDEEKVTFTLKHAMATFNQLKKKEQLFIVPLSMFSGMAQGFYTADFTKSYVQCAWSISHVGLVAVFFGLAGGISSTISGYSVKYAGRKPVVFVGLALHLGMDIFLLMWHPNAESPYLFYLTAALYGATVGIIWSQLQAFYGLLFKKNEEAAFATYYFCSSMGWTLSFAYSDYLCTSIKIYILMAFSCCGVLGYLLADRSFSQRNKS